MVIVCAHCRAELNVEKDNLTVRYLRDPAGVRPDEILYIEIECGACGNAFQTNKGDTKALAEEFDL